MKAMLVALAGSLCAVSAASADPVNMKFVGFGQGRAVRVTINDNTVNLFAGQLRHTFSGGTGEGAPLNGTTRVTFGLDASKYVAVKWTPHSVSQVGAMPGSPGLSPLDADRAQAVYDLYSAAGGSQAGAGADADYAAAFQIALWEIAHDFNAVEGRSSLDVASGSMKAQTLAGTALNGSVLTWVNSFFDSVVAITAAQTGLLGVGHMERQSQVVMIPLPNGALLGLAGLASLGVVGAARRRLAR